MKTSKDIRIEALEAYVKFLEKNQLPSEKRIKEREKKLVESTKVFLDAYLKKESNHDTRTKG